jgi:hypothetical protein
VRHETNTKPHSMTFNITFDGKKFLVDIKMNHPRSKDGSYHYDIEIRTTDTITGEEFQKLKKYLEEEGYIDAATNSVKYC